VVAANDTSDAEVSEKPWRLLEAMETLECFDVTSDIKGQFDSQLLQLF
jgi:hypothetical protein